MAAFTNDQLIQSAQNLVAAGADGSTDVPALLDILAEFSHRDAIAVDAFLYSVDISGLSASAAHCIRRFADLFARMHAADYGA